VHRDIKPENILLEEGHAVLADFGVARAIDEARSGAAHPRVTGTGMSVGTPTYMAPEQASGERHIDARADLYALAVVGYEMLAGKLPFTAPSPQAMLAAHLTAPPPAVTKTRPDVPAPVATAISKALAKTPDERYATAEEFRDALDPAAAAAGGGGRKRWIGLGIAAAVLVAGGALLATFKSRPKLDDHVLAVAPFDVLDPDLKLWHEGMVDVLSRNLDGAGASDRFRPRWPFAVGRDARMRSLRPTSGSAPAPDWRCSAICSRRATRFARPQCCSTRTLAERWRRSSDATWRAAWIA